MRRIVAALVALTVLSGATACTSDDAPAPAPQTAVSLGVIPIVDVAPVYLGKQKGFFSRRGIALTLIPEQAGPLIVKGVLDGRYAFGFSNATSLMAAGLDGAPVRAVANGVASTGRAGRDFSAIVVPDGSPVKTAKDLAGKQIAVNALKSLGDTSVRQSVRKAGGDPRAVRFKAMPFPAMPGALQAHTVDAAWVVEPQLSEALALGAQVVTSNLVDTAPDLTVALYFTSQARIGTDPDLVSRFTAAVGESLTYADGHPDEIRTVVGTYTKISDSVRTSMILPVWPQAINRPSLQRLADLGRQDGTFAQEPKLDLLLPAA